MKIGFIGLGIMGAPMPAICWPPATNCSCAPRSKVPEALAAATAVRQPRRGGAPGRRGVPDAARHADVETVLFGKDGVADGLSKGKTVVDMSSISPMETKRFAAKVNALGCDYLDAPVSGGEVGARPPA